MLTNSLVDTFFVFSRSLLLFVWKCKNIFESQPISIDYPNFDSFFMFVAQKMLSLETTKHELRVCALIEAVCRNSHNSTVILVDLHRT